MHLKPSKQNVINPKRTVALDWDLVSYGYSGQKKETRGRRCPQVNSGSSGGVRGLWSQLTLRPNLSLQGREKLLWR